MNPDLRRAISWSGRPAWKIARDAGLSRTQISHIMTGVRAARPEERAALSRVLGRPETELFPVANEEQAA
jgi:transcriptional regulator with XRE-family HTH domain